MRRSPRREGTAAVLAAFVLAAPAGAIRISRGGDDSHGTSTMIPQPGAHPRMPWVAQLGEPSDVTSMPDVCRGRGECSAGACAGSFTCARTTPDPTAGETVCVDATGGLLLQAPVPTVARRALLRRKAAEWMRSNDRRWLFSFLNICETLGFEASRLRSRVLRLAEQRHGVPERGP